VKMMRHPRFDDDTREWRALPYTELHATGDADLYNEDGRGWPVWKGGTFDRYRPDLATPVYWAEPDAVLARLQTKRENGRGVFAGFDPAWIQDTSTLPALGCRVVFRDVVRATDRRSMKACLAPPNVFAIHDAPQLVWPRGDSLDEMALLGVLNSIAFDWLLRRRVETHVTFSIINALPVPELADRDHIARLAGRLSCIDDRYADYAARLGIEHGPLDDDARSALEAEIDARVARAYGLTGADFEIVLSDFVEAAIPTEYRERVLELIETL
jgi:hypothetical protein